MTNSLVYADIQYFMDNRKPIIKTNLKNGHLADFLGEYIHSLPGRGEDRSNPTISDVYNIRIECDLTLDKWSTHFNTGNKGLRDGIIIDVYSILNKNLSGVILNPFR